MIGEVSDAWDDEQIKEALHCCGYMDQQRRDRIGMEESVSASPAPTPARQFFMNDPRFRCTGTEPYTEYEMAVIEENLNINGIPVFEFAEIYAKHESVAKPAPSEADLARIAVRHFPVKLESQLGIVKKDVNAEGREACLAALREACGMGGKA